MKPQRDRRSGVRQSDVQDPPRSLPGGLALAEIFVATIVVVGFFGSLSEPLGWSSAGQFLLSVFLGVVLFLADARLTAGESDDVSRYHPTAPRESPTSG